MLDLIKAMEIANRLCEWMVQKSSCASCPCYNDENEECCFQCWGDIEDWAEIENRLNEWDKEHPIPQYPTWEEWQKESFPKCQKNISLCNFVECPQNAFSFEYCLDVCRQQPIPTDIAKKLGIKPKEVTP